MLNTSARLLRLLSILQARPDWTGPQLARRLEVTERTLRRDVARLRELGYPVHGTSGVAGGYRLGAGAALPPLLLDDDEAVAVVVALRTARQTITGIAEASARALAKIEQVLPPRLRRRSAALGFATVPLVGAASEVDGGLLTTIAHACRDRYRLGFRYTDRAGAATERRVEPHRLVHTGYRWYLVARDTDRRAWRSFRVDRIEDARTSTIRFAPSPDTPDAAAFVARALATGPYRYQARVRVAAPAGVVAARVPATAAVVAAVDARTCDLTSGSDSLDAIAAHLTHLGLDFTVLEPPELRDRLRALADRLYRSTGRPAGHQVADGESR